MSVPMDTVSVFDLAKQLEWPIEYHDGKPWFVDGDWLRHPDDPEILGIMLRRLQEKMERS